MRSKHAANMMKKWLRKDRLWAEGTEENAAVFNRSPFLNRIVLVWSSAKKLLMYF
jgi:hypothetical protein